MKRILLVMAVVAALSSAAFASAAWLPVQGGTVQAGYDYSLSCDPDGVQVTAWAVNTIVGPYEGIDWVTISGVDKNCAGNDLVVRVDTGQGPAYGGDYNQSAAAAGPSNAPVIKIVADKSDYKVALHHDPNTSNRWFVPAEIVQGIHVWIGGPTSAS